MTKQEFDNYRFGIKTRIVYGEDENGEIVGEVVGVDFGTGWIEVRGGKIIKYYQVRRIFDAE